MSNKHFTTMHYVTFAAVAILVIGAGLWAFNRLSSDAIGMALGLGFGVLAGIPATLLVFVASRPRAPYDYRDDDDDYRPQTIVIIPSAKANTELAPTMSPQRTFVIIPRSELQSTVAPWERTAPPPQASKCAYDENTTVWPYPIAGMQIRGGEAERPISGITLTNTVEFALRTGAPCVVSLDEWERHVQAQSDAQGMRYAFFR